MMESITLGNGLSRDPGTIFYTLREYSRTNRSCNVYKMGDYYDKEPIAKVYRGKIYVLPQYLPEGNYHYITDGVGYLIDMVNPEATLKYHNVVTLLPDDNIFRRFFNWLLRREQWHLLHYEKIEYYKLHPNDKEWLPL